MPLFLAALGLWLGTTDLCTQGTAFKVSWGWGCSHSTAHPEATPVGTQAPGGDHPPNPDKEDRGTHPQGEVSPSYAEPDTQFTCSFVWENSWALRQKLKFIRNLNIP